MINKEKDIDNEYPSKPIDYFLVIDKFINSNMQNYEMELFKLAKCYVPDYLYKFFVL